MSKPTDLAADVRAVMPERGSIMLAGTARAAARRQGMTDKAHAALDALVAQVEEHAYYRKVQQTFGEEQFERAEALEAALAAAQGRLPDDTVCACLSETGERKVEIVERCLRCGSLMYSDAYHDAEAALADTRRALEQIQAFQPKRLEWYRKNEIVFRRAPGCDSTDPEAVAFWTYTDLCEIESIARHALAGNTEDTAWGPDHPSYDEMGQ